MTECMKDVLTYINENGVRVTVDSIKLNQFTSEEIMSAVKALEAIQMIRILRRKYVDNPTVTMIVDEITEKGYAYLAKD